MTRAASSRSRACSPARPLSTCHSPSCCRQRQRQRQRWGWGWGWPAVGSASHAPCARSAPSKAQAPSRWGRAHDDQLPLLLQYVLACVLSYFLTFLLSSLCSRWLCTCWLLGLRYFLLSYCFLTVCFTTFLLLTFLLLGLRYLLAFSSASMGESLRGR